MKLINQDYSYDISGFDQMPIPVPEDDLPYDAPDYDRRDLPESAEEGYTPAEDEPCLYFCAENDLHDAPRSLELFMSILNDPIREEAAVSAEQDDAMPFVSSERTRCIREIIAQARTDKTNDESVDVLSVPCGIGKSTAISEIIGETILRNDGHGLIVITDDIKRLADYLEPKQNEELAAFLSANASRITLMTANNAAQAHQSQFTAPVLLMTTQRFLAMPQSRFADYLTWSRGDRPLVLIDERIALREVAIISLSEINDIATMLAQGIDNTANQVEKSWCIAEWEVVRKRYVEAVARMETARPEEPVSSFFYLNPDRRMTSDDERFLRFVQNNRALLMRYKGGRAYKSLFQAYHMEKHGALYQGRKGEAYSNKFSFMIDHRAKFSGLNAKVIVLDGTADLHPDYEQDYIRRLDVSGSPHLQRRLDRLTIRFFNVPTSKRRLLQGENKEQLKQCIVNAIARMIGTDARQTPIFTYSEMERFFRKEGFAKVEHFGDIKGSNAYRENNLIVQVGLNRFEPLFYETYALYEDASLIEQLPAMSQEESSSAIRQRTDDESHIKELMNRMILADIEQNVYRSAIRNADCDQDVEYWIFCNAEHHRALVELVKERYEKLGAHVPAPTDLPETKALKALTRKTKKPSTYRLYVECINNMPAGMEFTREYILNATGIKPGAFYSMMRTHPELENNLHSMRIEGKERKYRKP